MSRVRLLRAAALAFALLHSAVRAGAQPAQPELPDFGAVPIELPELPALGDGSETAAPDYHFVDEAALPFAPLEGLETTRSWGTLQGAGYRIEVPAQWNGALVIWAWGFTGFCLAQDDPACRLTAREPWIRRELLERGFAWANSSLTTSGWAVSQGVLDNLVLQTEFTRLVAPPERVYMIGLSMGGKIAAIANERGFGYAGTLALCGELGADELGGYWVDWNLLAATLAHEEARIDVPPSADYLEAVVPDVRASLGRPFPSALSEAGLQLRAATARVSGGERPRYDSAFALADVPLFGSPETMFSLFGGSGDFAILLHGDASGQVPPWPLDGNEGVVYQLDADPALSAEEVDLNARVPRIAARATSDGWTFPAAEGRPTLPLLALHGLGDLLVPFSLPQRYAERAAANGAADRLVTRATRGVTHCNFTRYEIMRSFDDLVAWVETGTRPAGDDFLDAAAVAAADFGCAWSGEAEGVPRAEDIGICTAE